MAVREEGGGGGGCGWGEVATRREVRRLWPLRGGGGSRRVGEGGAEEGGDEAGGDLYALVAKYSDVGAKVDATSLKPEWFRAEGGKVNGFES